MLKLIQNVDIYAPEHLGVKDVLIAGKKVEKITEPGELASLAEALDMEVWDGEGLILTPGFVDCHVHILGGGGEGGFANRTPEATKEGLNKYGVTTVVGCLGTDGIARDMCALIAKAKGLNSQGMTAYCYTGSYQIPVRTLTGSITKDIMMVEECIGTGEIAISDHRSSQPTYEEFTRMTAETRLGGMLSGKAGVINIHVGDGKRCLDFLERTLEETEIPAAQFLPTHINRNAMLFDKAVTYAKKGGYVDFTGYGDYDSEADQDKGKVRVSEGIARMLSEGVDISHISISSDGQGSLPVFKDGVLTGMGVGTCECLLQEVRDCVCHAGIPLETALCPITSSPAEHLQLSGKGRVAAGYDADFCILSKDLRIRKVYALGETAFECGC